MISEVSRERLDRYFSLTEEAFGAARKAVAKELVLDPQVAAKEILDMVANYLADARHFEEKGELVLAFAALNYAHGWLDAGARLGVFTVKDSRLFVVDDE